MWSGDSISMCILKFLVVKHLVDQIGFAGGVGVELLGPENQN